MSDENNEKKKRKRPKLYKKDDTEKDEDVLKKLRDVRKNLQDSIDEEDKPEKSRTIKRKRGARKLYKKDEEEEVKITRKYKKKTDKKVSQKRLARVQKRVKEKVEEAKGLSKKRKAAILIWLVIMSAPLFFITTLSVMGLEMNFSDFGLEYLEDKGPGNLMISFPARNPSFLPAQVGSFEMELYDDAGNFVGKAYNNDEISVAPYDTKTIFLTLKLEKEAGGEWLSNLLSDLELSLNIQSLTYNGMQVNTEFLPPVELDIEPLIRDAITGMLDIEELLGGLSMEDTLDSSPEQPKTMENEKIELDPYTNAKRKSLLPRLSQSEEDSGPMNVSFAMSENKTQFNFGLGAIMGLGDFVSPEDLGGIKLGPINMSDMDVQLMVNDQKEYEDAQSIKEDENWADNYNAPIAKLFTTKTNEIYLGGADSPPSVFGMNLTIFKDDINDEKEHPSSRIDWDASADNNYSLESFLAGKGNFTTNGPAYENYPGWYFLYNLLHLGKLDCGIKIKNIDINIFGLDIEDVSIPMDVLPPLVTEEGVLDPDNMLKLAPDYGLMGMMKHFVTGMTEGPSKAMLGIPSPSSDLDNPESVDTLLDDFINMIEFPDFTLDQIEESWGSDANLSVGLPISLNNTMLDFYCGFKGMKLGLGTEINNVRKTFMTLGLTGNESDQVYIDGMDSYTTINIDITIFKNKTIQPFAAEFLKTLISNFTLDGILVASFDELQLFQENYTWGAFDAALPLEMDLESMLMDLLEELVPGLIGGLTDTGGDDNATQTSVSYTPISMLMGMNPMPALFTLLGSSPKLQQYPTSSQEEEEDEDGDPISDLLNGLINDLVGGLFGDLLGSEMEFELGLDVDVIQGESTTFTISLNDFYIEELFISLGLGNTDLRLQSKDKDGEWQDMVGIQVDEYFDVKGGKREDIAISLTIYETKALCTFIHDFMEEFFENDTITNTVDLRATGTTNLNLSGIYMPDLAIDFKMEDFDLGLNGSELVDGIDDMIYDIELDAETGEPEPVSLWAGTSSFMPRMAQGINVDELFKLGEISILDISETDFGNGTEGIGTITLSAEVINYMMSLDIKGFNVTVYETVENGTEPILDIEISDGPEGLTHSTSKEVNITLRFHKNEETAKWINNLLNDLSMTGSLNISAELNIFGCDIRLKSDYLPAINLTKLTGGLDIASLLGSLNPFSGPFMDLMGPRVSQDINTDSILENVMQFSIADISLGNYQEVGPLNYEDPLMSVGLSMWLQTMFNMSIDGMNLQLLDGGLYDALYVEGGHDIHDVAKEASIAEVSLVDGPAFFNSCYPGAEYPDLERDPNKPYLYNTSMYNEPANTTSGENWDYDPEDIVFELDNGTLSEIGREDVITPEQFDKNKTEGGGFNSTNVLGLQKPTLNRMGLEVNLLNKSHGTWDTRYKRKYWSDLGGPYFPVQEYDGYPDHYYEYHPYYAPLVSFLNKATKILDENASDTAIADLINGIAIAGEVNVTMFSMDIEMDLYNPKLNALFEPISGLVMGSSGLAMKEYLRQSVTPLQSYQHPREQMMERLMMSQGIDDLFGDLLNLESIPIDINEITLGITFPGIPDRTTHAYSTQTEYEDGSPACWDGQAKYDNAPEYTLDPDRDNKINGIPNYTGSLDDPYFTGESGEDFEEQYSWREGPFTPKETFVKDEGYEWFKGVADNWAQSRKRPNPYFETHYTKYNRYQDGDRIEDPTKWPLLYDRDGFGGRCRTHVLNLHTTALLTLPVTVLSGKLSLWMEDPFSACQYMPFGYTWINESVNLQSIDDILYDPVVEEGYDQYRSELEWNDTAPSLQEVKDNYDDYGLLGVKNDTEMDGVKDNDMVVDQEKTDQAVLLLATCGVNPPNGISENGEMPEDGWTINFNVRMFEGPASYEFFSQLISSGDFNIHFLAQGLLNVSAFGYELYDIYLPYDMVNIGDPSQFQSKCDRYLEKHGSGGYPAWGVPSLNGTLTDEETVEEDEGFWPHYLVEQQGLEFAVSLPIDMILDLDKLMGNLMDELTSSETISAIAGDILAGDDIDVDIQASMNNPVPLSIWLTEIFIELWMGTGSEDNIDWQAKNLYATDNVDTPLMELTVDKPYNLDYNSYENFSTPQEVVVDVHIHIPRGRLGDTAEVLISALLGGEAWIKVNELILYTAAPAALGYNPELNYDLGDDAVQPLEL
ncbi:MAG: hypothetical protein R6U96_13755 [Promethearchaeia archaeon]